MDPDFQVQAGAFEGPLDLLLTLIEKKKMHISDVSLAAITDDYIAYVNEKGGHSIADTADFILVAATLMLIKSLALLPGLSVTPEEQASIEDLENRLKTLERMRALSRHIEEQFGRHPLYAREAATPRPEGIIFAPPRNGSLTAVALLEAVKKAVAVIPQKTKLAVARVHTIIRLEDVITNLMERVTRNIKMSFREFAAGDRMNIIVSFLAVLELVKQGSLAASQSGHFGEIQLESMQVSTPRYD